MDVLPVSTQFRILQKFVENLVNIPIPLQNQTALPGHLHPKRTRGMSRCGLIPMFRVSNLQFEEEMERWHMYSHTLTIDAKSDQPNREWFQKGQHEQSVTLFCSAEFLKERLHDSMSLLPQPVQDFIAEGFCAGLSGLHNFLSSLCALLSCCAHL